MASINPVTPNSRQAAALIVAIWVIGLLSLLVGSFAFQAHLEARITSYYRKRLTAETIARAGIERAWVVMINSGEAGRHLDREPTAEEMETPFWEESRQLARGMAVHNLVDQLGPGTIRLSIRPEPARLNINTLDESDWTHILELCRVPERWWDELIDAFMDWTDPREFPRLDGVDPDYYLGLDPPYQPRGGPIDSLDELLLIKGFTPAIVYGGTHEDAQPDEPPMTGLTDLFTTVGDGKVNVNAASLRVLMALPGVDEQTAQDIIRVRDGVFLEEWQSEDAAFRDRRHFFREFPGLATELENRIVMQSSIYRITSVGEVDGVERGIETTVQFDGNQLIFLRWSESDRY